MKKIIAILSVLLFTMALGCDEDSESKADSDFKFDYKSTSGLCQVKVFGEVYMGAMISIGGDVWAVPEFIDIARIAVDEINEGGGINGKQLGLVLCDSQCLPKEGEDSLQELLAFKDPVSGGGIGVIVGPSCSYVATNNDGRRTCKDGDQAFGTNWTDDEGASHTCTEVVSLFDQAKQAKVPLIGNSTESDLLTSADDGGYYFRTIGASKLLGTVQGNYLSDVANVTKLSIVYPDDSWGTSMAGVTQCAFGAKAGAACTGTDTIVSTAVNMIGYPLSGLVSADVLTSIDAAGSDGVFLMGYDTDTTFVGLFGALKSHSWANGEPHLELSNALTDSFYGLVNDNDLMEGMGGIVPKEPSSSAAEHFAKVLKEKAGHDVASYYGATYDAFKAAATGMAIASEPTNGEQIQAALANKTQQGSTMISVGDWAAILSAIAADGQVNIDGSSGPIDFDANGDVSGRFTHQSFNNAGKYDADGCWTGDGNSCE